jgi:hypothetical protein
VTFDVDEAFEAFEEIWPEKPGKFGALRKQEERKFFKSTVIDANTWGAVRDAAAIHVENGNPGLRLIWLKKFLSRTPVISSPPAAEFLARVEKETSLYSVSPVFSEVNGCLARILETWPRNDSRPENNYQPALAAIHQLRHRYSFGDIEATCRLFADTYNDPASGILHAYHLKNFLDEDIFSEWNRKMALAPKPEDVTAFSSVWEWYPDFTNKSVPKTYKDCLLFWIRHIKTEERWAFLSAVKAYHHDRRSEKQSGDTTKQYTKNLIGFIGTWRETKFADRMAGDLAAATVNIAQKYDLFDRTGLRHYGERMTSVYTSILTKDPDPRSAINQVLGVLTADIPDAELETWGEELYKLGWELCCKSPIKGVC